MEDQRIMFIMRPVHTRDNSQGASGTRVRNRPLSHKGLICMPWKNEIWTEGASIPHQYTWWHSGRIEIVATSNHYEDVHIDVISFPHASVSCPFITDYVHDDRFTGINLNITTRGAWYRSIISGVYILSVSSPRKGDNHESVIDMSSVKW